MQVLKIILAVIAGLIILSIILMIIFMALTRKETLGKRHDDNGTLHYFSCDDYPGMTMKRISFKSRKNNLAGYFYQMEVDDEKPIVVLSHGMGAGHVQYMHEIAFFAKNGYRVFTYDVRGCYNSEGKGINYMSNALLDLHAALCYLEQSEFAIKKVILFGHSMGAYCVNNIPVFNHKNVVGIISLSGFNSVKSLFCDMFEQYFGKFGKVCGYYFYLQERMKNGRVADASTITSLKNVTYPVLLLSGDKDPIVTPNHNFDLYQKELSSNQHIEFIKAIDRYHRPNLSLDAAEYDQIVGKSIKKFFADKENSKKPDEIKKLYDSFDYYKLVEFDDEIMGKVLSFCEKCR